MLLPPLSLAKLNLLHSMRKNYTKFFLVLLFVVFIPFSLQAIDLGGDIAQRTAGFAGYDESATETTLSETIGYIIKVALTFVGTIFLVLTVYAGFLWMTARGEGDQIEKAQEIIKAATIGLILTVSAYSITAFVVPRIVERTSGPEIRNTGDGGNGGGGGEKVGCCMLCHGADSIFGCTGDERKDPANTTNEVEGLATCKQKFPDCTAANGCILEFELVSPNECR